MNIRFVEAFVWVVRLNSFRAAAEKLYISQATVSSRIAALETEFGCCLLDRDHSGFTLTSKGVLLLDKAEKLLHSEQILQEAMRHDVEVVKRVRIGVIESVVHTWLPNFLEKVKEVYPKIEFELTAESTFHLQALFAKGALDVIIHTNRVPDETVTNTELKPLEIVWVCHCDSPIANRQVSLEELSKQQLITFTRGSWPHLSVLSMFERAGLKPNQVHCVSSLTAISMLTQKDFGVATLPITAITEDLESGRLALVNMTESPEPLRMVASWRRLSSDDVNKSIVDLALTVSETHAGK